MFSRMDVNARMTYAAAALTYGGLRKAMIVKDAELYKHSDCPRKESYPLLFSQKAALVGIGALSSIYVWPYYAAIDICKLECSAKGLKVSDYMANLLRERPTSIVDYVLS